MTEFRKTFLRYFCDINCEENLNFKLNAMSIYNFVKSLLINVSYIQRWLNQLQLIGMKIFCNPIDRLVEIE